MKDLRVYFGGKHMFDYTMKRLEEETDFVWANQHHKPTKVLFLDSDFPMILILHHNNELTWTRKDTTKFDFDVWKFLDFYFN